MMDLYSVLQSGRNIKLEVTGEDLVNFAQVLIEKSQEMKVQEIENSPTSEKLLTTAKETAEMCHICSTTLWAWSKTGYLVPTKVGSRRFYKESDVRKLMNDKPAVPATLWPHTTEPRP